MNVEGKILINKFAQDVASASVLLDSFNILSNEEKRKFLHEIVFLLIQLNLTKGDIIKGIEISGLKKTYTPVVMISKGYKQHDFIEINNLPDNELEKVFVLYLSIYKVGYNRLRKSNAFYPSKWWFNDLSDESYVNRIRQLSNIRLVLKPLKSGDIEMGTIITAALPFATNLFEKNIIETSLVNYAFNKLYPYEGINIYKEMHDDICSIIVLKNINELDSRTDNIGIV